jgi:hypothetical protein
MRPGNYAYFDRTQVGLGAAAWADCALTVLARVVSRPAPDAVILDSGSKTLTKDLARGFADMPGYGAVLTGLHTAAPDERLVVEICRRNTLRYGGPRGSRTADGNAVRDRSQSLLRRVEPGRQRVGGGRDRLVERLPVAARGRIT